jgi:hypothetical protein
MLFWFIWECQNDSEAAVIVVSSAYAKPTKERLTTMSHNIIMPTEEEDAEINAGIAADPDTYEWTDEDFANARSAYQVLPELFGAEIADEMLSPKIKGRQVCQNDIGEL